MEEGHFLTLCFLCVLGMFTYIIGHYNPSLRIIDLISHTTYVVCVNFLHKWRDLQFKVFERFLEKLFMAIFIYSQIFCQKPAERKSPQKYFSYFVFDVWPETRTLAFRLISQHLKSVKRLFPELKTEFCEFKYIQYVLVWKNKTY